jgi:sugar transferase (PEP-CTERM system associated)
MLSKSGSRTLSLMLVEAAIAVACGLVALAIRFGAEAADVLLGQHGWLKILLVTAVVQASFFLLDLYDLRMIRQRSVLFIRVLQALGLASIALSTIFYVMPALMIGRGVFLISILLTLTMMMCWRVFAMWALGHPKMAERVLILGTGSHAVDIAREVLDRRDDGYQVVGFVGDDPSLVGRSLINPSVIGVTEDLEALVRAHRVDRIVVAIEDRRGKMPVESLLRLTLPDEVVAEESVSFFESLTGKVNLDLVRPSWLIYRHANRGSRLYRHMRRLIDVVLSAIGLVLAAPIMAVTAIAIKLDSKGPVIYSQERVGMGNRPFRIYKFRSMRTDAESNGAVWAGESDARVTRVGRIIRTLRIDEIPQFINILRGDMSFIGPRPERPIFVDMLEREIKYYAQRHLVKPGLTGWAQVRYRYGASIEEAREKFQYDLYYIKNQSPLLDAIILFETIRIVLFGRGAR